MKIFIAGGAGFIGSHLVDRLIKEEGTQIVVYDNLIRGRIHSMFAHYPNPNYTFIEGDIRDFGRLQNAARGADIFYHLADFRNKARGTQVDLEYCFSTLVNGTYNILNSVAENDIPKMVLASAADVYSPPFTHPVNEEHPLGSASPFGAGKIAAEMYCRVFREVYAVDISIVRLSECYGTRDKDDLVSSWIGMARQAKDIVIQQDAALDIMPVEIAVAALIAAGRIGKNQTLNAGSGKRTYWSELARRIISLVNSSSILSISNPSPVENCILDVSKMETELNVQPPGDPLAGLEALVAPKVTGILDSP